MAHTTILSLFVLLALSLSSHAQTTVDWPNLTSTTLGQVPASAFLTINSTELGSIPPTACQGFTYNQVQNIPATASPGFTSAQIKQMPAYANSGCGGFTGPAMGAMTPAAFSGFTENCIAVLPATALANWNADQVSNIQAAACNGFTMSNIQGMNASAFAGFSAQQVAQFDAAYSVSGCSGILPAQVAAMQPAAFAGWTEDCVSDLLSTAFNTATAAQMSNFPSAAAPGMRYNFVQNIAPAAGAGFSSILLSSMDYQYSTDGCYGLQPALIANIPAASWSGWTEGCVGALIPTAWNMTTADQIAQITKSAANGLDYQTVQNLPPAAGAGWTATALSGVSYQYSTDGCAGFQPAHIATMQPAAFAGWTEGCIGALPPTAFSMINAAQLNQLTPAAAAGFTYRIVQNMSPESGAGWNVNNLAAVSSQYSTDGCGGFQPWHVANILPPVFAGWTADCISILPPTAWNMTTADQISNLTAAAGDGFGYQLVKNLPAAAGAGWNAANLAGVSDHYSTDGCGGFQPWHVAYMQPQAFAGWTADCVSILISTAWNMTNAAQIGYLTAAAADGLSYSLVQNMPGETGAGWTATNLAGVADQYSLDGCAGFTASQVGNMTTNAFTGWTENCVGLLSSTAFSNVNAQQITSFSTTGAAGMSAGLMRNIPPMAAAGWTTTNLPAVSSYYYSDGCGGFTADQIAQIPLSVYPTGWTADCVGLLNATIFLTINLTQMTAFSNSAYTGFEGVQIANIPDPVLTAIPLNKLVALSASGTQGFTPHQLTLLIQKYGADFVNLYSVTQLSLYGANNISNIEQFKALVPNTIAPILTTLPPMPTWLQLVLVNTQVTLDAVTVNNFNWSTVWGITPTQAAAMSDDAIKVLTTGYYPFRLLPDTVGAWSCSQLAVIMPAVNLMMDPTWNVTVTNATKCPNSITSTFGEPTTGGSTWVSNTHTVSSSSTSGHGISGGEAAGIAVGGVVLVAGITGAAFFLVNRQRQRALYRTIT